MLLRSKDWRIHHLAAIPGCGHEHVADHSGE
jgi:hypothetical protein